MTTVSDLEQENVAPNNRAKKISAEIAQESCTNRTPRKNPNKLERIKPQHVEIYNFLNSLKISLQRLS